ncbi:MAG: TIGR02587 family membrane protein [Akkermansiaceae bacterium]|nr:TIGR02587 family membrane protein [Armatimonadota bacterium]
MASQQNTDRSTPHDHTWKDEIKDLMRGIGGAAIIGVPLVYTMEMWQVATTFNTTDILLLLCFGFTVCVGYNLFSGFRDGNGLTEAVKDAVEAVAIGVLLSTVLMALLGVIDSGTSLSETMSKIAVEAIPLAIGASVANTQFDGGQEDREASSDENPEAEETENRHKLLREIGIAAAGSVVFAASIAPTEEVALVAQRLSPLGLIAVAVFSLALSYGMIFIADFTGSEKRHKDAGILQSPLGETLLAYAVALAVSLAAVVFFHGVEIADSPFTVVALTVSLGLPAAIGGAAGRLIV